MSEKEEMISSNSFSEEEQRSAVDAFNAFSQGQFDSCITTLKKIQKNHPGDCKLMHNRAIAEFYKSGQTKTSELKKNLSKVYKVTQQSHQEDDELSEETTSIEYSVLHFNQAVLYYNLHQYMESQSLLEAVPDNLEISHNMREICLLLVEIYLINYDPEKAGQLITKIEENFLKPVSPQQSKNTNSSENKGKSQKSPAAYVKEIKSALPLLKTRCSLQMKSMKACKRELKAFANLEGTSELPAEAIQILSVFLKSNLEFQRGNFHKAYKLLGSSPPTQSANSKWLQNGECLTTMYFNNLGVIHFHVAKHSLGTFYLTKALEENDKSITTTSKKADGKHQQQASSNVKTIQMLGMNKKFEILYNMGIQLLFSGKPSAAFDCLIISVQVFYSNPRLWLRLAECCIQACCSAEKSEESSQSCSGRSKNPSGPVPYTIVGSGIHQKLIIHPLMTQWNGNGNSVMPGPTLEFASVCLQNALTILSEVSTVGFDCKEKRKISKTESTNKKSELSIQCFPAAPVSGQELNRLHASILSNSAFVALNLGNNLMAYEYSKKLLQMPNLSGRQRYLGRMYSAEALVSLDRIADAIQQLSSEPVVDISDFTADDAATSVRSTQNPDDATSQTVGRPLGPRTTQICFRSTQHAQACMLLNLATAHSLRSEFEKAQKLLTHFSTLIAPQDVPSNAILLSVYINLHTNGGFPVALKVLQHNALAPQSNSAFFGNIFAYPRTQQQINVPGYSTPGNSSYGGGSELSSNGSISGGSSGSRSKSSTPQPAYSGPPSGSVTPERMVKAPQPVPKVEINTTKTKRGRR